MWTLGAIIFEEDLQKCVTRQAASGNNRTNRQIKKIIVGVSVMTP